MDTYLGDGLNLYAYVQNNPVRYVDPSGHCAKCSKENGVSEGGTKNNRHHEMCAKVTRNGKDVVKENNVIAVYESSTETFYWRPFNDIKLKGSVLQTVEDKDGKSVSWRYWQNDKGYWKRAIYKEKK